MDQGLVCVYAFTIVLFDQAHSPLFNQAFESCLTPEIEQDLFDMANLAKTIIQEFHQSAPLASIDTSISHLRNALLLQPTPHPHRAESLYSLAEALFMRFDHAGLLQNLDETILLHREALRLRPTSDPDRLSSLVTLAASYAVRFSQTSNLEDLKEALDLRVEAIRQSGDGSASSCG